MHIYRNISTCKIYGFYVYRNGISSILSGNLLFIAWQCHQTSIIRHLKQIYHHLVLTGIKKNFCKFIYFNWRLITLQYCSGFCHTLTWISHGCTCIPHPKPPFHLPPHPIPQGCPSAPALRAQSHALNLDWWSISHKVIYMFQCYSLKSSHPHLLPQSPKVCSLYLCLF